MTYATAAGASGYILKDEPVEEVTASIRAAAAGEARISPGTANALLGSVRGAIEAGRDMAGGGLSTTELQVLDLVAAEGRPRGLGAALDRGVHGRGLRPEHRHQAPGRASRAECARAAPSLKNPEPLSQLYPGPPLGETRA